MDTSRLGTISKLAERREKLKKTIRAAGADAAELYWWW